MLRGFTLIEILIVMGIAAILAGLAATWSFDYVRSQRVESAARFILADLTQAQTDAYTQANDSAHGVLIESDQTTRFEGDSYATRTVSADVVNPYPSPVTVSGLTEVVFPAGALAPVAGGAITISSDDKTFTITVSDYGLLSIE